MDKRSSVSIACASGFWGDTPMAVPQILREPHLDYIVFDYLSEVTLTILAKIKKKDPEKGFIPDFLTDVITPHLETIHGRGIKLVCNAGALNPEAMKKEIEKIAASKNLDIKVSCVTGDDLLQSGVLPATLEDQNGEEQETKSFISANVYLGALPVQKALANGAHIVITGRVVDTAVVIGPLLHEYPERAKDFDFLAQASLAGHIIECGTQCCGGNFTDWQKVPRNDEVGFPIVRFYPNGEFEVTKVLGTGGLVNKSSVSEQIVYEIGDPHRYILPDVVCDFSQVEVQEIASDIVRVTGARGLAPTSTYKVCATRMMGYKISATAFIGGHPAKQKAHSIAEAILTRCERWLKDHHQASYVETLIETLGSDEECLLRISAVHEKPDALEVLAQEMAPGALSLAPGMTNLLGGRASASPRIALITFLHEESKVEVYVDGEKLILPPVPQTTPAMPAQTVTEAPVLSGALIKVPLRRIAYARSGDKGDDVNIGVIARSENLYTVLRQVLTPETLSHFFKKDFDSSERVVHKWELPKLNALNFLLKNALGGGGAFSLRIDPQGKAYAQRLLELEVMVPKELL
jgi:hypothetical protein